MNCQESVSIIIIIVIKTLTIIIISKEIKPSAAFVIGVFMVISKYHVNDENMLSLSMLRNNFCHTRQF